MLVGIIKVLCVLAVIVAALVGGYITYLQMQRDRWNTYMKWAVVACVLVIIIAIGLFKLL